MKDAMNGAATGAMRRLAVPMLALVVIGAAWGATQPLGKIAVSEGYRALGLLFWQLVIVSAVLGALTVLRGHRLSLAPRQRLSDGAAGRAGTN